MSNYTDKMTVLATLQRIRARWDDLLGQVPAERMTLPGAAGAWSPKDVIAHVAAYEEWMALQLSGVLRGETHEIHAANVPPEADTLDIDQRNQVLYALHRDRALVDILSYAREVYYGLLANLQALPAAAYARTDYAWTRGQSVGQAIAGNTFVHYEDHIPAIEALLAQTEAL